MFAKVRTKKPKIPGVVIWRQNRTIISLWHHRILSGMECINPLPIRMELQRIVDLAGLRCTHRTQFPGCPLTQVMEEVSEVMEAVITR